MKRQASFDSQQSCLRYGESKLACWIIARNEIVVRFTDPVVLLLTIVMPLVLAALVDLAFGSIVLGRGIPDTRIRVGVVNQDRGGPGGNVAEALIQALIHDPQGALTGDESAPRLFSVEEIQDEQRARRMVQGEELIAALIIPPGFSQDLWDRGAAVHLYVNGRSEVRGAAFKNLVEVAVNRLSMYRAVVQTATKGLVSDPRAREQLASGDLDEQLARLAWAASLPESSPVQVQRVQAQGDGRQVSVAQYLAAAMAVLFTGFTALVGSASTLQEQAQGTLQRMLRTPTPLGVILGGKALGAYLNGLLQMAVLIAGMSGMAWLSGGGRGTAPALDGLLMLIVAVVAAATGLGSLVAGLARSHTQAANGGRGMLLLMGLVGGIFFPVELFPPAFQWVPRLTFHYWAMDGYLKLARGAGLGDLVPHLLILGGMAALGLAFGHYFLLQRLRAP